MLRDPKDNQIMDKTDYLEPKVFFQGDQTWSGWKRNFGSL